MNKPSEQFDELQWKRIKKELDRQMILINLMLILAVGSLWVIPTFIK